MAKHHASEQTGKRRNFLQKNKKQLRKSKSQPVTQPRLPKTASEVSSNWKALAAECVEEGCPASLPITSIPFKVLETSKEPTKKTSKRKRFPNKSKEQIGAKHNRNDIKTEKSEIWFDDVDEDDIEKVTCVKQRKISANDDVYTHTHNETQPNDVTDKDPRLTKHVAMDCEFVGVGREGSEHMLARVSIVNIDGVVLYDKYVAAQERVVDYRTDVSGIRPYHLKNAPNFTDVQKDVAMLIKDKILIGHSISTDLKVLLLDHPRKRIRDTAKYKPFQEKVKVEDARAAIKLYSTHRKEWEKSIKDRFKKSKTRPDRNS